MTPVSINSLSKEMLFHIFSLVDKSPKGLLTHRAVCRQWNENITELFCSRLKALKTYTSEFDLINQAIQQIPESKNLNSLNVVEAIKKFNAVIAEVIHPWPVIPCKQEVKELEQQLKESSSLEELWNALPIANKPQLKTLAQVRKWFEDEQNQPLLDTVTTLDLNNREITHLPREIFKLYNLKELDLSWNSIEFLPDLIKTWTQLVKLDLCDNELEDLNRIEYLKNLEELNISANRFTSLPPSIGNLKNLESLNIEGNHLIELPSEVSQCTSLKILKVSGNHLSNLPIEIKGLVSLIKFYAFHNQLDSLPEGLGSWEKIEKVRLANNHLNITNEQAQQLWPSATEIDL
ncbi:MAG: leucine-rich repeat domain-containing protein [Candidatus Rhabdochlamydia sp.]